MPKQDRKSADKALPANPDKSLDRLLGRSASTEEAGDIRRAVALGIRIDTIGGNAPVQAEGFFDDKAFYFRARHDFWTFEVGPKETPWHCEEWEMEGDYGTGEDASWMPIHEALGLICDCVEAYRAEHGSPSPAEEGQLPHSPRAPK